MSGGRRHSLGSSLPKMEVLTSQDFYLSPHTSGKRTWFVRRFPRKALRTLFVARVHPSSFTVQDPLAHPDLKHSMSRRTKVLIALGVLVVVLLVSAKPAYRAFKANRFQVAIEKAEGAFESNQRSEGDTQLALAFQLSNKSPKQLEQMFEVGKLTDTDLSGTIATSFYTRGDASAEEKLDVLEYLSSHRNPEIFLSLSSRLPSEDFKPLRGAFAKARFFARQGHFDEAIAVAEAALEDRPLSRDHVGLLELYLLGHNVVLNQGQTGTHFADAANLFRRLVETQDENLVKAALQRITGFDDPLIYFRERELSQLFETYDPNRELIQARLFVQRQVLGKMFAGRQRERLKELVELYKADYPAEIAGLLVEFNATDLLEELEEGSEETNLTVYYAKLESLLKDNNYPEVRRQIEEAPVDANRTVLETILGAMAFAEGDNAKNHYHISRAFQSASFEGSYTDFNTIMTISERFGDASSARKAAEAISKVTPRALPDSKNLKFLDVHLGYRPELLLTTFEKLHATRPTDELIALKYAHLLTVTGGDLELAAKILTELPEDSNFNESILAARALVNLAQGDAAAGLKLLDEERLDWTTLQSQSDKFIYLSLLYVARPDQRSEAVTIAQEINWDIVLDYLKVYLLPKWGRDAPTENPGK